MFPISIVNQYGNIAPTVPTISALNFISPGVYLLYSTGELYYRGRNTGGKSGLGTGVKYDQWYLSNTGVAIVSNGNGAGLIQKSDGTFWITSNSNVLGITGYTSSYWSDCTVKFTAFMGSNIIDSIHTTTAGIVVLLSDSTLWVAGSNSDGQLGLGAVSSTQTFTMVASNVKKVFTSNSNTFYIDNDNKLYGTGYNNTGQLGDGTVTTSTVFNQISTGDMVLYPYVHDVCSIDTNTVLMCSTEENSEKVLLACGSAGSLGQGSTRSLTFIVVQSLSTGVQPRIIGLSKSMGSASNMLVLTNDGIYGIGANNYYQLGNGNNTDSSTYQKSIVPTEVIDYSTIKFFGSSAEGSGFAYNNKVYSSGVTGLWGTSGRSNTFILRTDTLY